MPTNRSHETDAEVFIAMTIGGGLRPRMTGPDLTRPFEEMAKEIVNDAKTTAGGALILFALSGGLACNFAGSPTPITRPTETPTVTLPKPTEIIHPTSTPKPTEAMPTPTVIANIPPAKGPITEPTPTPDTLRETLTGKAKLYYEKNPLIVKGNQLNGILVSERTPDNKILISVRTFTGVLETAVLAGNWGYFSANDKSEITGIIWATKDTFTDSQGKTGYLGDSEIATAGAGFFGAKQVGYWTKEGKIIATVDPQTGNPVEIKPAPTVTSTPTEIPTPTPVEPVVEPARPIEFRNCTTDAPQALEEGIRWALEKAAGDKGITLWVNGGREPFNLTSKTQVVIEVVPQDSWRAYLKFSEGNRFGYYKMAEGKLLIVVRGNAPRALLRALLALQLDSSQHLGDPNSSEGGLVTPGAWDTIDKQPLVDGFKAAGIDKILLSSDSTPVGK